MIHPHFTGPERSRVPEVLSGDNKRTVRSPNRVTGLALFFFRNRLEVFPFSVHDPDIFTAVAVTCEDD